MKPSRRSILFCGQRTKGKRERKRKRERERETETETEKTEKEKNRKRKKERERERNAHAHTHTHRHIKKLLVQTLQSSTLKVPSELGIAKRDMWAYAVDRTRIVNAFAQKCIAGQPSHNNLHCPKSTWPTESTKSKRVINALVFLAENDVQLRRMKIPFRPLTAPRLQKMSLLILQHDTNSQSNCLIKCYIVFYLSTIYETRKVLF